MRAMDEDPRLASGVGAKRADNVLDFIQMTGLTTGDPAAAERVPNPPIGDPEDPISFFEYGVRDVDGSGDPVETLYPELDSDAFRVDTGAFTAESSRSLNELRQIIAELASEENTASNRATTTDQPLEPETALAPGIADPESAHELTETKVHPEDDAEGAPASDTPSAANGEGGANRSTRGLETARELLHELSAANEAAAHTESTFAPVPQPETPAARPAPASSATASWSQGLPRRRRKLHLGRWFARALTLGVLIAAGYGAYWLYTEQAQTPRAAYRSAEALIDRGNYTEASNAFLRFARRHASHPLRADALFMAGFALQLVPPEPQARANESYTEALALLENFLAEYPTHEKVPRAETLMGILHYRTGRYLKAINILGDPDRRLRDPGAYLTALRTLGRAYAQVSQIDNARSAFMRAAALQDNMAPDEDYVELAALYRRLAEQAPTTAERERHLEHAIEQWNYALQVPGLLKSRKEDIKLLRDVAASKLKEPMRSSEPAAVGAAAAEPRIRQMNRGNQEGEPRESALAQGNAGSRTPLN